MSNPRQILARYLQATEFATPEARKKYLDEHPNADPKNHSVKKDVSFKPKRPEGDIQKEVGAMSAKEVNDAVGNLSDESKTRFDKVLKQLSDNPTDKDRKNALLQVHSEGNHERVETKRQPKAVKSIMKEHDLEDDDVEEVKAFKKKKPSSGVKVSDAELMARFMRNAKPETKARMKGMSPKDFVKLLGLLTDEDE